MDKRVEFFQGVKAELPLMLGVVPFGLIFGALAVKSGIPAAIGQAMSSVVFAGSAQYIAAQLLGTGTSGLVVLMVVFVVNLRHALYSASVAPHIRHLSPGWKLLLSYLLTDEAYAVTITYLVSGKRSAAAHWYFLGAGLTLWTFWQVSTAIGIFIGAQVPQSWPLGFALPLTFIALVVPALTDRAGVIAALAAGLIGVAAGGLPLKTGLLLAAFTGIAVGMLVEGKKR